MPDVDFYAILGVPQSVSDAELRSAYRRLVRRAHPDNGGNVDTFQLIQHAYRNVRATRTVIKPTVRESTTTKTRRRPDRWKRMVCWSCGMRTARRPLVVVLTKLDAPDQQVDLPYCDWCWSQRVNVRDRRMVSALQTATASSRVGFAVLVAALLGLVGMIGYLWLFFEPSHSLFVLLLTWAVIITLLVAGLWPISKRAIEIRQQADDFHQRLVDHPTVAKLLDHGYRL
ncbi:J domain-containing protein [Kibdelosporangium philippinense]|uniref:J domain-containing protein n=1 Tax=Kibdelosporangium philippinense TaxID=211113 RepID=A0ABS8ZDS9_9PSEU|nr:J domain-containing protein [Kibdelosporangium philippinense]MCE7004826.1 J domain-containing protein [Kibdelosporangium philippinense]